MQQTFLSQPRTTIEAARSVKRSLLLSWCGGVYEGIEAMVCRLLVGGGAGDNWIDDQSAKEMMALLHATQVTVT
jgi:hypothetical protein